MQDDNSNYYSSSAFVYTSEHALEVAAIWRGVDVRDRRVDPSRIKAFDRAAVDVESEHRPRTEDDRLRIARARAIWNDAVDPRGTVAETYLRSRALALADDVAGNVLRYHPRSPWRN